MGKINWTLRNFQLADLTDYYKNPRSLSEKEFKQLKTSLDKFGMIDKPIVNLDSGNTIIGGHQRKHVLEASGVTECECWIPDRELSEKEVEELNIRLNKNTGSWDFDTLANEFQLPDLVEWGFEPFELGVNDELALDDTEHQTLADRFIVPPFSVLDARQGYWQERKKAWIALGIRGELGRDEVLFASQDNLNEITGTKFAGISIFDPVLCELAYRWFAPTGGHILDLFAGGSVRGIVASKLGYKYTGIDLSARQIEANNLQANELLTDNKPNWIVGDSKNVNELAPGEYVFIFSCPPYADLEVYSDDPNDLSTMDYPDFKSIYHEIIYSAVTMLKPNRFACFVVGDVRDKKGFYRNFPAHTIEAFQDAGMTLYNEAILVTAVGSLPIRVGKQFGSYRKLGKTHQNVLVFFKGDPATIKTWGAVECGDIEPVLLGS